MDRHQKNPLFVFAGEQSGDLHGSHLVQALKQNCPELSFEGVCGPRMRMQGVNCFLRMEDFEVMGLSDVLLALPKLYGQFRRIRDHILGTVPEAVVLIDYPGFNLRMAKALRKGGYTGKIIQYVSPTVWAWGKHRIEMMAETLDMLMTIYPFESACFAEASLKTVYVGNPIQEYIRNYQYDDHWHKKLGVSSTNNLIAIFPGSRQSEIKRNLPIMIEAASHLKSERPETRFGISCSHQATSNMLRDLLKPSPLSFQNDFFQVPKQYTYELMRDSRCAIAKSGTVTLELALHQCPTVAVYKLTTLNRLYAKHILKLNLPHYCIVNILTGQPLFPELIEKQLSPEHLFKELSKFCDDGDRRKACIQKCGELRLLLGEQNASANAAESIKRLLTC